MKLKNALLGGILLAGAMALPSCAQAEASRPSGMTTSSSISVTVSTKEMTPGGEMWALWLSLPAGTKMDFAKPSEGKWSYIELGLSGAVSEVQNVDPATCELFSTGRRKDVANQEFTFGAGDGFACTYARAPAAHWKDNRGTGPFAEAQLALGGPAAPGDLHTPGQFDMASGHAIWYGFSAEKFAPVHEQLLAAGAMTLTIRQVTMPPGARVIVTDPYPVVRLITKGDMKWGTIANAAAPATSSTSMTKAFEHTHIPWRPKDLLVILNDTSEPQEFVEYSVVPAPGITP